MTSIEVNKSFSSIIACSDDEGSVSSSDSNDPIPFYRRAHALWGPSRVYRNVRYYTGNSNTTKTPVPNTSSPSLEKHDSVLDNRSTKSKQAIRPTPFKWSSSSSSPSS